MKRVFISIFLALVMLLTLGGAALADEASVEISDITVTGDGWVGTQVTVSGTVEITATADADDDNKRTIDFATAAAFWGFSITGTDTKLLGGDSNYDADIGKKGASADASFTKFTWSQSVWITDTWEYDILIYGGATTSSFSGWFKGFEADSDFQFQKVKVIGRAVPTWFNNGQFEVAIGELITGYHWGLEMSEGVITDGRDMYGKYYDKTLEVVISAGTKVTGSNRLQIGCDSNNVVQILTPTTGTTEFSQPVKVYWSTGSGNILIASISKIVDGVIQ